MQYLGGKEMIAKHVAEVIGECDEYVEPFMGGLSIGSRVKFRSATLNDAHPGLAVLYTAWLGGWRPERIDEAEYKRLKSVMDLRDPMTTFAGFGLSFSGKWFRGMASSPSRPTRCYAANAYNSLDRKLSRLVANGGTFRFSSLPYDELTIPDGAVVYCDPPYADTTGYVVGKFDSRKFWAWAEKLSARCQVLVSERKAPEGWVTMWEQVRRHGLRKSGGKTVYDTEKVFRFK